MSEQAVRDLENQPNFSMREFIAPSLSLFTSAGTLICCALPALFVTIGAGAALAGLTSAFPALIWLSRYKIYIFIFAAVMLAIAGYMQWRARYLPCPADPLLAKSCMRMRRFSLWVYIIALILYLVGAFFAFLAPKLLV